MENNDPRYIRSREALRRGLVELASVDPQNLTVSAMCAHTGVDRATFYRHFAELDDLVADALADLAERGAREWGAASHGTGQQSETAIAITTAYFRHITEHWLLYRWALGRNGSAAALHALFGRVFDSSFSELKRLDPKNNTARHLGAYAAGGMLGVILDWLQDEQPVAQPEELARWAIGYSTSNAGRPS